MTSTNNSPIKVIDTSVKLDIALEALKQPTLTTKELSAQFNVSESTVRRAKKDYATEALKAFELLQAPGASQDLAVEPLELPRGYRPRNGRMEIIRDVGQQMGLDSDTKALYTRVNEVAAELGVEPIKKSAFYVLICEVRKAAKVAAATVKPTDDAGTDSV